MRYDGVLFVFVDFFLIVIYVAFLMFFFSSKLPVKSVLIMFSAC